MGGVDLTVLGLNFNLTSFRGVASQCTSPSYPGVSTRWWVLKKLKKKKATLTHKKNHPGPSSIRGTNVGGIGREGHAGKKVIGMKDHFSTTASSRNPTQKVEMHKT